MRIFCRCIFIFLPVACFICVSCAREAYNISYTGVVVDEETNCPLPHSVVQSFCLFQQNIDESATLKLNTHTDSLGQFKLTFDRGYKIGMAIAAQDYVNQFVQFKPHPAHIPDTIFLKRKLVLQTSVATKMLNLP
ncbi:hypothetical protein SAMN06265379_104115 [Saccharicrinis carchari]|uniref:Carboxypeptidase regulatory-like domain-containing protein n=1 Tax=Saccharicrinis carchari TaxID=1168039 RepID=A0A521D3P9_SACCC|nr:hypothetical protein [Saccharicrinis carchari]SMO65550.1 hypothetical protein SAMN06265379_104115 [Saccharicrinis carchari]